MTDDKLRERAFEIVMTSQHGLSIDEVVKMMLAFAAEQRAEAFAECARICRERVPTEVPLLGHGAGATSVWPRIKGGDECARDIERAARKGTP